MERKQAINDPVKRVVSLGMTDLWAEPDADDVDDADDADDADDVEVFLDPDPDDVGELELFSPPPGLEWLPAPS